LDPATTTTSSDETSGASSAQSNGPHRLTQALDLTQASALRDQMILLLQKGAVVLDARAVERMSTPCLQVLLAAGFAAAAANTSFQIVNASDSFKAAVADLGLQSRFTDWMV
jgi:anti-anti-sigma regulatory factor